MAIKWNFEWYSVDGRPVVKFDDWVATLTSEDQTEYASANERQQAYQQEMIDNGNLEVTESNNQYIWKDQAAESINKPNDPIWFSYWTRWQNETGSRCRIVKAEV